jgi:hypothetical protein
MVAFSVELQIAFRCNFLPLKRLSFSSSSSLCINSSLPGGRSLGEELCGFGLKSCGPL